MKIISKNYIFAIVNRVIRLVVNVFQRHLSAPVLEEGKAGSSPKSSTGVVICSCISTHRNLFRIRHARIYNNGLKRNYTTANQRRGVTQVSIMNKQGGATSYLKPSGKTNDRLLQGLNKTGVYFQAGVGGKLLLPRSLTSFPLAGLNFNN